MNDKRLELAEKPLGMDEINRARELCGNSVTLNARLDVFLKNQPTRGQMLDFIEDLEIHGETYAFEADIMRICKSVGIDQPTGTDKLLALQIGLLQEQNDVLEHIATVTGTVAEQTRRKPAIFGPVLAAVLLGKAF